METQTLILGLIIVILSLLVVAWPFLGWGRERAVPAEKNKLNGEMERLVSEREAIYAVIRDLDFDYETGKLTDEDYQQQRETWVARGVTVLKAIDSLKQGLQAAGESQGVDFDALGAAADADLDAQIEAAVAARRRTV
ncbi:MAG: hypothetical protein JXN59_05065 [Anaerolineae bacterium]|nr:hypothetical protein [Anaerolineae bacterium]